VLFAWAAVAAGCSSGQDKSLQGSLTARLSASRPSGTGAGGAADPLSRLQAVNVSVSGVEARGRDGGWVPVQNGLPVAVDLLALANVGDTVTLPGDLLPEGPYSALQVRINQVDLTVLDGSHVTIAPEGRGWLVLVPVDFTVDLDRATIVGLEVHLDQSIKFHDGAFEFDPTVDVDDVERGQASK